MCGGAAGHTKPERHTVDQRDGAQLITDASGRKIEAVEIERSGKTEQSRRP